MLTKTLIALLVILLLLAQYRLWVGEGSFAQVVQLRNAIAKQTAENEQLKERNRILNAEVKALKNGLDAIEEKARSDMGMIKEGETFFMFTEEDNKRE